jgi:hypothetical protein
MKQMNCLSISRWGFMFFVIGLLISCERMSSSGQDRLIARAENHYLYLSDVERSFDSFASREDSLIKVNKFIDQWARQKLLYEKSLINLPGDKITELSDLVNTYQSDLFMNAYREFVLKSSMDTLMTEGLLNAFYEEKKHNFKLKEPIYRIRFISFPIDNVDQREITKRFKKFDEEDVVFLDSLSFQFSNYFLSDSVWLNEIEIRDQLYFLEERQQDRFLKTPNYYEVKDSLALYLLALVDRLDRGNIAPLSYVESTIKDIVFNKKKIEFLRSFDNDILQDAIKTKKFETY